MFMHFIKSLNWVDILMLAILVRIVYISVQTGFVSELFKFLTLVVTVFLCFHYYSPLALLLFKGTRIPMAVSSVMVFLGLWLLMAFIAKLIRGGLALLITVQAQSLLDKWGAAVLSINRFFLAGSMVFFILLLSGSGYLHNAVAASMSHKFVLPVAVNVYRTLHQKVVAKLFPGSVFNKSVEEELKRISKP
jgi:uncharacterized membrane protein required for colicin V production